jgi:hypothetical protein
MGTKAQEIALSPQGGESDMMDLVFVGLTLGFFGLTWLLVKLCESV